MVNIFERIEKVADRYDSLANMMVEPDVVNDFARMNQLNQERYEIEELALAYRRYQEVQKQLEENQLLLDDSDADLKAMVEAEINTLNTESAYLEQKMRQLLLPKDPKDDKNVIIEIRAGTGGEEAGLFAYELLRLYTRWAERQRFKTEMMSLNETGIGGIKEAIVFVKGKGVYSKLKFESGVHRVQRVPATESSGRIHTSAATVAVLPEADEVDVQLNENEVRIDVYRASGPGGQGVNTTDSAVRLTHIPTGLVIACQDERSQLQNKAKAFRILRSKLYDLEIQRQTAEIMASRKSQVGSGDRSEKIRTYNFPQSRVTDHRINKSIFNITAFMDGDIDEFLEELSQNEQTERLEAIAEE